MNTSEHSQRPVAIVTGGARGIGRAISQRLAQDGYAVAINYAHSQAAAEELARSLTNTPGEGWAIQGDVSQTTTADKLVDSVLDRWQRIDVLVNNAGITSPGRADLLDATEEGWDQVFATNLKGPFFLTQRVCREMIRLRGEKILGRGTIVNVSSISSYAVSVNRGDYCLTKSALSTMTKLFAVRMADEHVFVYEVSPGVIRSDMTAPVQAKYDALIADGLSPIRRWGEPDDVAQAVASLAAGSIPFCTGQCLHVDGGFHIRRL